MKKTIHTPALVLGATPHRERDLILSLFSPDYGRLSLYMRNTKKSVIENGALASPLTVGLFTLHPSRTDLYRFVEGKAVELHLPLREDYTLLITALECLKIVKQTQWRGCPSPHLFHLICQLLKHLPKFEKPKLALSLLRIKLLKHEGLISSSAHCPLCQNEGSYFYEGQFYCREHAPKFSEEWEKETKEGCFTIYNARNFPEIETLTISEQSEKEIEKFFNLLF
jgi:DNA repair protein RecO (recombination protein O)